MRPSNGENDAANNIHLPTNAFEFRRLVNTTEKVTPAKFYIRGFGSVFLSGSQT